MNSNRAVWIDSAIVIVISLGIAALSIPFESELPIILRLFFNHYTPIVGYLCLCFLTKKLEVWHLAKVSLAVWAILTPIFLLMYWHLIGSKYTLSSIIFGELKSQVISVILGGIIYFVITNVKRTIAVKKEWKDQED